LEGHLESQSVVLRVVYGLPSQIELLPDHRCLRRAQPLRSGNNLEGSVVDDGCGVGVVKDLRGELDQCFPCSTDAPYLCIQVCNDLSPCAAGDHDIHLLEILCCSLHGIEVEHVLPIVTLSWTYCQLEIREVTEGLCGGVPNELIRSGAHSVLEGSRTDDLNGPCRHLSIDRR
jgi:hypothetical protein